MIVIPIDDRVNVDLPTLALWLACHSGRPGLVGRACLTGTADLTIAFDCRPSSLRLTEVHAGC